MTVTWKSHVDEALEPYPEEDENVVEGTAEAGMRVLRDTRTPGGTQLIAGVWECQPCVLDLTFEGDETVHVLNGEAVVEVGGEAVELSSGTIASFKAGERSRWTVRETLRQFFVLNVEN